MTAVNGSILLVDDEPDLLEIFSYVLKKRGMKVFTALDAQTGMELLRCNPDIQLIVSDQAMPDMRGWEFYMKIRQEIRHPRFLLMTGSTDVSLEKAYSAGMCGVLRKPLDNTMFFEVVKRTLETPDPGIRKHERESAWVNVAVAAERSGEHRDRALALNISAGGLFLGGTSVRSVGTRLNLTFEWKGQLLTVAGTVVWNRQHDSWLPRGMGICFEKNLS